MKRAFLFLSAALMISPVFAAGDICQANLQKIDDSLKTDVSKPELVERVGKLRDRAVQAQAAGDTKTCIATSSQALALLERPKNGGSNN